MSQLTSPNFGFEANVFSKCDTQVSCNNEGNTNTSFSLFANPKFYRRFVLISSLYLDKEKLDIKIYRLMTSYIFATVQTFDKHKWLIPQSRILNPLGGDLRNFVDTLNDQHNFHLRWSVTFQRYPSTLTVWPKIRASGNSENPKPWNEKRVDEPHVTLPTNPNDRHHLFRGDGVHYPDTTAGRIQLCNQILNNNYFVGYLANNKGDLVNAGGHTKTCYYKDLGDGTYFFGQRKGREITMGGRGTFREDKERFIWVKHPKFPDRGYFRRVKNPDYKGEDPEPGGGQPKPPKPPKGPTSNPSKGGYVDRVQQNNLQKDHNASNPHDPMAKGGSSGEIGGVGIKGGLIEGLFDGVKANWQTEHLFFLPSLGSDLPFSNEELHQLLRELAKGIFEHDALPFFSLHFNAKHQLYPVLHPVYQNTLIGEVIAMLDYLMKGFLNGGFFDKDAIELWRSKNCDDNNVAFVNLHNYCLEHKDLLPPDFEYSSLTELIKKLQEVTLGVGDEIEEDAIYSDISSFTSAFRIIAKQNLIHRADELFFLDGDFEVHYDLNVGELYKEHLNYFRTKNRVEPKAYLKIQQAYKMMAENIREVMPRLPICSKYFKMLKVIQFFSHYFQTLKTEGRFPLLPHGFNDHKRRSPTLFPSLPIRAMRKVEMEFTAKRLSNYLTAQQEEDLQHTLKNCERDADFPDWLVADLTQVIHNNIHKFYNTFAREQHSEFNNKAINHIDAGSFAKRYLKKLHPFFKLTDKDLNNIRSNFRHSEFDWRRSLDKLREIDNALNNYDEIYAAAPILKRVSLRKTGQELREARDQIIRAVDHFDQERKVWHQLHLDPQSVLKTHFNPHLDIHYTCLMSNLEPIEAEGYRSFVGGCGIEFKKIVTIPCDLGFELLNHNVHFLSDLKSCNWSHVVSPNSSGYFFSLKLQNFFAGENEFYAEKLAPYSLPIDVLNLQNQIDDYINGKGTISFEKAKKAFEQLKKIPGEQKRLLFVASQNGNERQLRMLSHLGIELTLRDENGYSALHYALMGKNRPCMDLLIEKEPTLITTIAADGNTPLMIAVQTEVLEVVKGLTDLFVKMTNLPAAEILRSTLNHQAHNSMTPLACAVHRELEDIVIELLKLKPDLEITLEDHTTPIGTAAKRGNAELVSLLKEAGANINAQNKKGYGPLHFAAEHGHHEIVQILDSSFLKKNARLKTGKTALHLAARGDHVEVVKALFHQGADPKLVGWDNESYFLTALFSDSLRTAQAVIANAKWHVTMGFKERAFTILTMPNLLGQDPLSAATNNYSLVVAAKLDNAIHASVPFSTAGTISWLYNTWRIGPQVDCRSTPIDRLYLCCKCGLNFGLLKSLLQTHQFADQERTRALQIAAHNGHSTFVNYMFYDLENKAEDLPDDDGKIALHYAAQFDLPLHVRLTAKKNPRQIWRSDLTELTPLALAAKFNSLVSLKVFLKAMRAQGQPLQQLRSSRHPMHMAIQAGHVEAVELMLRELQDPNVILDNEGRRPIHAAASIGDQIMITFLKEYGADLSLADNEGKTALHFAVLNGRTDAINQLIDLGVGININEEKGTPLHLAAQLGQSDEIVQLIQKGGNAFAKRHDQKTPFDLAVDHRHPKGLRTLLESLGDLQFYSPAQIEIARQNRGILALLERPLRTGELRESLFEIIERDDWEDFAQRLNGRSLTYRSRVGLGEDQDRADFDHVLINFVYLHAGPFASQTNIFKTLAEQRPGDLNRRDQEGKTLAHFMALRGEYIANLEIDLTQPDDLGNTALHYYALGDVLDAFQMGFQNLPQALELIPAQKLDLVNKKGLSALHVACAKKNNALVKLLLKAGADPNQYTLTEERVTPCVIAAATGDITLIQIIIGAGGNPRLPCDKGNPPLHIAVKSESLEVVRILSQRSSINGANKSGLTPVALAASSGNLEILNFLESRFGITDQPIQTQQNSLSSNQTNIDDQTPLELAALFGQPATTDKLWGSQWHTNPISHNERTENLALACGLSKEIEKLIGDRVFGAEEDHCTGITEWEQMSQNDRFSNYRAAVSAALLSDNIATLKAMFDRGWNVHHTLDIMENRSLHLCARKGSKRCCAWLIEHGASVTSENCDGQTPLALAILHGHVQIARYLIACDQNLDLNHLIERHQLLHRVIERNDLVMAEFLLIFGIDLHFEDENGRIPIHLAALKQNREMIRLFLLEDEVFSPSFNQEQMLKLLEKDEILHRSVQECCRICAAGKERGDSQIHLAIRLFDDELLSIALRRMHPDQINQDLESPLHLAAKLKQTKSVRRLIARGADLGMRNADNQTALQCAKAIDDNSEVIGMLCTSKGSNPSPSNSSSLSDSLSNSAGEI